MSQRRYPDNAWNDYVQHKKNAEQLSGEHAYGKVYAVLGNRRTGAPLYWALRDTKIIALLMLEYPPLQAVWSMLENYINPLGLLSWQRWPGEMQPPAIYLPWQRKGNNQ